MKEIEFNCVINSIVRRKMQDDEKRKIGLFKVPAYQVSSLMINFVQMPAKRRNQLHKRGELNFWTYLDVCFDKDGWSDALGLDQLPTFIGKVENKTVEADQVTQKTTMHE